MKGTELSTEQKVLSLRKEDSRILAIEIARRLNVSREIVRVYLKKNGLPTKFIRVNTWVCEDCSSPVSANTKRCKSCARSVHRVTVSCSTCGKEKNILRSQYKRSMNGGRYNGKFYCNRICFYASRRGRE